MEAALATPGFHDAAIIDALEPKVWLELFAVYGFPPGLNAGGATLEHIVDRLAVSGLPEPLQGALEWLYGLGSPEGCERIAASAREANVDLTALKGLEPVEFVARVALMAATSAGARRALDRALTGALIAAHPASRVHEFQGRVAKALSNPEARLKDLRAGLLPLLDAEDLGDRVDVTVRHEGGVTRLIIVRGKRLHAPVSFTDSGRRPLRHRPVQCDLVVYDASADLISIHTSASLVDGYRRLVGEIFWGDPDHLVPSRCSLEPLKEGRLVLERHGSADVRSIELTYAKFRPHQGGTCEYTGKDAFELMKRMNVPMAEGDFVAARFRFLFYGAGRRPMTVEVTPPTIKADRNNRQQIVLRALQNVGIWRVEGESNGPFFWELAAGAHLRDAWRRIIPGTTLDGFVSVRALVNRRLASVGHVAAPGAGPVLDVIDVEDDPPFYGQSVDERVPGRQLTSSEIEGLELDAARFAAVWAEAMECTGEVRELPLRGLFSLGELQIGSKHLHVLLALREPQQEDVAKLAHTFPSPNVIVAPRSRNVVTWPSPNVRLETVAPDRQAVRRAIVREMHLESEVDARDRARAQDTLIIDARTSTVWLHGTKIDISGAPYLFALQVARATQVHEVATNDDLILALAGKSGASNTASNAKLKAEKLMKAQLKAAGLPVPRAIFASKQKGYIYVGHAFVGE